MKQLLAALVFAGFVFSANSQILKNIGGSGFSVSGKLETDILFPQDVDPNDPDYPYPNADVLSNTYFDLMVTSKYLDAGARFEMYERPLPGYDKEYKGEGIPFFYFTGRYNNFELTAGNFYEQFGSGMIFRTYEERSLGVDNSLRGGVLTYRSRPVTVKVLGGQQRYYWDYTDGYVLGGDAELNIEQLISRMRENNSYLQWGISYVSKYEDDDEIITTIPTRKLNLPKRVGAVASRLRFQKDGFNIMTEYAVKANDPNSTNNYIYKNGTAFLLSGSYSQKGMGILLQAKRSDNMDFRSERSVSPDRNILTINHLPAFTRQHTYALPAMYPYATQPDGEWAFQAEFTYKFPRGSALGGARGTGLKINYSRVNPIERRYVNGASSAPKGSKGYSSPFFGMGGGRYYEDINIEVSKAFTRDLDFNFMYMYQAYNQFVIQGHSVNEITDKEENNVYSHIFVVEGRYKFNRKFTLRGEAQYLTTEQDKGDWLYGLLELSFQPSWTIGGSDMYNSGRTHEHFYQAFVAYAHLAHRVQLSYGRTREGINCSGGVCRRVPESKGFQITYSMSF